MSSFTLAWSFLGYTHHGGVLFSVYTDNRWGLGLQMGSYGAARRIYVSSITLHYSTLFVNLCSCMFRNDTPAPCTQSC